MRIRSPSTAPPVKGLLGSTAITPTVCCRSRITLTSASASVLLPVPGAPVNPTRYAFPVWGWTSATSWLACGSRSSARLMARASARTSPESKAPAKLISDGIVPPTLPSLASGGGKCSAFGRREGFQGEVGAEDDRDAGAVGRGRNRSHHPAEVILEPGDRGGGAAAGAVKDLRLGDPLRRGWADAGLPSLRLKGGRHDARRGPHAVGQPVAAAPVLHLEGHLLRQRRPVRECHRQGLVQSAVGRVPW